VVEIGALVVSKNVDAAVTKCRWNGDAEGFGGLEIDYELELSRRWSLTMAIVVAIRREKLPCIS